MKHHLFSYRHAAEILQHSRYAAAWSELVETLDAVPLYRFPNKSKSNKKLDVVQQLLNTHFDRILGIENSWEVQPLATKIEGSKLSADFRKQFGDISIQVEVQFGNMSRWYSDIFKFQAAYSRSLTDIGVSIVPVSELAKRIDSNIVNFERACRELPAADLSITLPILLIGLEVDSDTKSIEVSKSQFGDIREITGQGNSDNRWRIVNGICDGQDISNIGPTSAIGATVAETDQDDE